MYSNAFSSINLICSKRIKVIITSLKAKTEQKITAIGTK